MAAVLLASVILSVPTSWAVLLGLLPVVVFASLLVKDPKRFLLAILVFALSLNISKTLVHHSVHYGGAQALEVHLLDFPLVALYAIWAWEVVCDKARRVPLPSAYTVSLAVFVFLSFVSITQASDPALALFELFRIGRGLLILLYVVKRVDFERDIDLILVSLFLGFSVLVGETLVNRYLGTSFNLSDIGRGEATEWIETFAQGEFVRAGGSLGAPNALASYVSLHLPIAVGLLLSRIKPVFRIAGLVIVIFGSVTLFFTMSRGAWVAVICAFLLMLAIAVYRRTISGTVVAAFAVGGASVVFLMNLLSGGAIWLRLFSSDAQNVISRYELNAIAFKMIAAKPILGVGLNNFTESAAMYDPTGISSRLPIPMPVHNTYLLIASEIGIVGLIAFLVFVAAVAVDAVRTSALFPNKEGWILLGVAGGIATIMVQGVVDVTMRLGVTFHIFWLLSGLVGSAVVVARDRGWLVARGGIARARAEQLCMDWSHEGTSSQLQEPRQFPSHLDG